MKAIHKHNLLTIDRQCVMLPANAEVLTVQTQNGEPCLWVMADINQPLEQKAIAIYATGQDLPSSAGKYIGTYMMAGDSLGFHVFEV